MLEQQYSKEENDAACAVASLIGGAVSLSSNERGVNNISSFIDTSSSSNKGVMEVLKRSLSSKNTNTNNVSSYRPREEPVSKKSKIAQVQHQQELAADESNSEEKKRSLKCAPFYYYREHSLYPDDDALIPLTPPGKTPNFPAKMHAILTNPDLADIIEWLPHGRSWRVLKPREFEHRVLPRYFEHSKYSSFVRQTNGWGFRRISLGQDRNSYYNELFLRGLPHLCKKMKRHGVSEKAMINAKHEPDLSAISELYPVPEDTVQDDLFVLESIIDEGPRARMPVRYDVIAKSIVPVLQKIPIRMTPEIKTAPIFKPPTFPQVVTQSAVAPISKPPTFPQVVTQSVEPGIFPFSYQEQTSCHSMEVDSIPSPSTESNSISPTEDSQQNMKFTNTKTDNEVDKLTSYISFLAAQEKIRQQREQQQQQIFQAQGLLSLLGAPSTNLLHVQNRALYNYPIATTSPTSQSTLVQDQLATYRNLAATSSAFALAAARNRDMCNRASVASHLEAAASHIRMALTQATSIQSEPQQQPQHTPQALSSSFPNASTPSVDAQSLASFLNYNGMN